MTLFDIDSRLLSPYMSIFHRFRDISKDLDWNEENLALVIHYAMADNSRSIC